MRLRPVRFDEVGPWTEVKLRIISEYAKKFVEIVAAQTTPFKPIYIDGFAGPGQVVARRSGELIESTPLKIVEIQPPFAEYHFVDANKAKLAELERQIGSRPGVRLYEGNCNSVLLNQVFPTMTFSSYRKGLCFLDPYGLHLNWQVIEAAGRSKSIDLILNFPIYDMNINALKRDASKVSDEHRQRMRDFWGDDSWKDAAYRKAPGLFEEFDEKLENEAIVEAFRKRLKAAAGFAHVSRAIPMKNSNLATVYYLIGASQKEVAVKVINGVFRKFEKEGLANG